MERLTAYSESGEEIDFLIDNVAERGAYNILDLAKYMDDEPDFKDFLLRVAEKLYMYEDAEDSGKLFMLPIGIGKPCYVIETCQCGRHYDCKINKKAHAARKAKVIKEIENKCVMRTCKKIFERPFRVDYLRRVGKTVFATMEDAEKAIEEKL